jgi:hypothetical protein
MTTYDPHTMPPPLWPGQPLYSQIFDEARDWETEPDSAPFGRCLACGHMPFVYKADKAYNEGHIYSDAGATEFGISRLCEYCYDLITGPDGTVFIPPGKTPQQVAQEALIARRNAFGGER